jgi:hypothetical protein
MPKKSNAPRFAVCIDNIGYPASLEAGKLYQLVSDPQAEKHGLLRVIDESGEDYGYSASRFFILPVPHALEKLLKGISAKRQSTTVSKATRRPASSKAKPARLSRRSA